jgi:hypothetical protein
MFESYGRRTNMLFWFGEREVGLAAESARVREGGVRVPLRVSKLLKLLRSMDMSTDAGFGPFDADMPVGLTEYGGGSGIVEGSPTSQSVGAGGEVHLTDGAATLTVDEKIGVAYRSAPTDVLAVDPVTGLTADDVNV